MCVDEESSGKQNAPASIQRILKFETLTLAHDRSVFSLEEGERICAIPTVGCGWGVSRRV